MIGRAGGIALTSIIAVAQAAAAQSAAAREAAADIYTIVVPLAAGRWFEVRPAPGVNVVGRPNGAAGAGGASVGIVLPRGWVAGVHAAGILISGPDTVTLSVNVPERRMIEVSPSHVALMPGGRDSVVVTLRNRGNVELRVVSAASSVGGWVTSGGEWMVGPGEARRAVVSLRGGHPRPSDGSVITIRFSADGAASAVTRVTLKPRVEGRREVAIAAAAFGGKGAGHYVFEGGGRVSNDMAVDLAVVLGDKSPWYGGLVGSPARSHLAITGEGVRAEIGELSAVRVGEVGWLSAGRGWRVSGGLGDGFEVDAMLAWRDGAGYVRHLFVGLPRSEALGRMTLNVFGSGGRSLETLGEHGVGGGVLGLENRADRNPWSLALGAVRMGDRWQPLGSAEARLTVDGSSLGAWAHRTIAGAGLASSGGISLNGVERRGVQWFANGTVFGAVADSLSGDTWRGVARLGIRRRLGASGSGTIAVGAYAAGTSAPWVTFRGQVGGSTFVGGRGEVFYQADVGDGRRAWSSGVRLRGVHGLGWGAVGVEARVGPRESADGAARVRMTLDGGARAGEWVRWDLRSAAEFRGGRAWGTAAVSGSAGHEGGFQLVVTGSRVYAVGGEGERLLAIGVRKGFGLRMPPDHRGPTSHSAAVGAVRIRVAFETAAGASVWDEGAPRGSVRLTGAFGSVDLPLDGSGQAMAEGLAPGAYSAIHVPPPGTRPGGPVSAVTVIVGPGVSFVTLAAAYQPRPIVVRDLGAPQR